jgi:hypothetical protein
MATSSVPEGVLLMFIAVFGHSWPSQLMLFEPQSLLRDDQAVLLGSIKDPNHKDPIQTSIIERGYIAQGICVQLSRLF